MTAAEVEQAALARKYVAFGNRGPAAGATLDGDGEPTMRFTVPQDRPRPQLKRERCMRLRDTCLIEAGVNIAARAADMPHLR